MFVWKGWVCWIVFFKARSHDPIVLVPTCGYFFSNVVTCSVVTCSMVTCSIILLIFIFVWIFIVVWAAMCVIQYIYRYILRIFVLVCKSFLCNFLRLIKFGSMESSKSGAGWLPLILSDEKRPSSISIQFFWLTYPTLGGSFYMCSHDPFLYDPTNRILWKS